MNRFYSYNYKEIPLEVKPSTELSGQGGGCFLRGTRIRTLDGIKPIEKVLLSDTIIGYDRYGELCYGVVVERPIHNYNEFEDFLIFTCLLEEETFQLPLITANHAIYDKSINEHKEAKEFKIGETFTDINGSQLEILEIEEISKSTFPEDTKVYNLIVEECHTFIVYTEDVRFSLRVHNGGGGKDSAAKGIEEPNTLASEAFIHVLEAISEGEIVGVVGGNKGVLINQVPLENDLGKSNFIGTKTSFRNGTPTQVNIPGFQETTGIFTSNVEVTINQPVTINVIDAEAEAVDVTLQLPEGLSFLDDTSGALKGYEIEYSIVINGSIVLQNKIIDKTVTPYEFSHRIDRPAAIGAWSFTVNRISVEEGDSKIRNKLKVSRWVEITTPIPVPTYANTALVGIDVPASSVGGNVPARTYDVMGLIVPVPTNYDPILKTYSGMWDGNYKNAWTNNTSWILQELLINPRFGLQRFHNFTLKTDKFEFYNCAVFNDELIPDGQGGMAVRYSFDGVLATRTVAWQLLQAIASNMSAIVTINSLGEISLLQDRPDDPQFRKLITNSNVLEGLFTYTSSATNTVTTSYNITFNDRLDRYLPNTVVEQETDLITKHGFNPEDLIAYGIVDEFRARLMAKRLFRASKYQNEIVSFKMALNIISIGIGDIVNIIDNDFITPDNTVFNAGRIVSNSGETLTFDEIITLSPNEIWTFGTYALDKQSLIELPYNVGANFDLTSATITGLPPGDYSLHEFYFYKTGTIEPQPFKIISITEEDPGDYTLSGMRYDPDKWAVIEQGLTVPDRIFAHAPIDRMPPVTGIHVLEDNLQDKDLKTNIMRIVWDYSPKHASYDVLVTRNDGETTLKVLGIRNTFVDMENISPGSYRIAIVATGILGASSNASIKIYNYGSGDSNLLTPIKFRVLGTGDTIIDPDSYIFNDNNPIFVWEYDEDNRFEDSEISHYLIEVKSFVEFNGNGTPITLNNYKVEFQDDLTKPNYKGASWKYNYIDIVRDYETPDRDIELWLYAIDFLGRKSFPNKQKFNNPYPGLPTGIAHWRVHTFYATLLDQDIPDLSNLMIAAGDTVDFIPTRDTWVWTIPANQTFNGATITEPYLEDKFVRSALSDTYNEDDLLWSEVVFLPKDLNPPTNIPQNITHIETNKDHGMRDIVVNWDLYIQGDFPAEVIVLFIQNGHDNVPDESKIFTTIPVDLDSPGTFTFIDNFRGDKTRIGVAAGRFTVEGLKITQVNSPVPEALLCEYIPAQLDVGNTTQDGTISFNHWDIPGETKTPIDPTLTQQPPIAPPVLPPDNPFGIPTPFDETSIQPPSNICAEDLSNGQIFKPESLIISPSNLNGVYFDNSLSDPTNLTGLFIN